MQRPKMEILDDPNHLPPCYIALASDMVDALAHGIVLPAQESGGGFIQNKTKGRVG